MGVDVFFYGLFMDIELLRESGAKPANPRQAALRGWSLRIGNRATLVPEPGGVVYGIVMNVAHDELKRLYAAESLKAAGSV